MKFLDQAKIYIKAGNGGSGSASFRREKFVEFGGPDGGDGGSGGSIIFLSDRNLNTLIDYRYTQHFKAEHGNDGGKNRSTGADGQDIYIDVPLGTVVKDSKSEKKIFEITNDGDTEIVCHGGKGGRGNWHFKSSTNQTPRYAQPGMPNEEKQITLELKVLADVGLVGFPNAGKSTLLSVITDAKPKIGDYEFTTLKPNLGIVKYKDYQTFVMADIPGIIEGAAEGKGLGHYFLRHIERNSILLFLIPSDSDDIKDSYNILLNELKKYNPEMLDKQRLIAVTKSDLLDDELKMEISKELDKQLDLDYIFISSIANKGIAMLKDKLWHLLNE